MSEPMHKSTAHFTVDSTEVGHLYYFAPADRAPGPYLKQIHVNAIIDVAEDGTLGGVELIDDMPPPPNGDEREFPSLRDAYAAVLKAAQDFDDAANVEETNWTGWGEQTVPPEATTRRVKAGQALAALRDADPYMLAAFDKERAIANV